MSDIMADKQTRFPRRSLLKGAAVVGMGALAGCTSSALGPAGDDSDEMTITTDTAATTTTTTDTATTTDEGPATVVVRVAPIDSYTGVPPHDVTVTGKRHDPGPDGKPITFEVEIDGEVAEREIPEGTYDVTFSGEGYVTVEREVSVDEDNQILGADLPLTIPEHEVTIKVVDADGDPIDRGDVHHTGLPPEVYYTESPPKAPPEHKHVARIENGTATMTIPEGENTIVGAVDGCEPVDKIIYPEDGSPVTVHLECEQ